MSKDHIPEHRQQQAKTLRLFRKLHRITGTFLFAFFCIVSVSGLLLGWKKHTGDLILAQTRSGTSVVQAEWLPLSEISSAAQNFLHDSVSAELSPQIDRIDVRPDKGVAKIIFTDHFTSLQIDLATGRILNRETRRSDFIEHIHDGSLVDDLMGWKNGWFKLFYTTVLGMALLLFTITGFWLWFGPKIMRRQKKLDRQART